MKRIVRGIVVRLSGRGPRVGDAGDDGDDRSRKKVWRMDESAPGGHWVEARTVAPSDAPPKNPDLEPAGWLTSSIDLAGGAEVVELTVADLLDDTHRRPA